LNVLVKEMFRPAELVERVAFYRPVTTGKIPTHCVDKSSNR